MLQHAALESQLAESAQEVLGLKAQLAVLESELITSLPAQCSESSLTASVSAAAQVAEVAQLQADAISKEQEIAKLTRQLEAATASTSEVCALTTNTIEHCYGCCNLPA